MHIDVVDAADLLPDGSTPPAPEEPPVVALPSKPWWESKTVWVGILTTLIATLSLLTDTFEMSDSDASALLFAVSLLNILLRALTNTAITTSRVFPSEK